MQTESRVWHKLLVLLALCFLAQPALTFAQSTATPKKDSGTFSQKLQQAIEKSRTYQSFEGKFQQENFSIVRDYVQTSSGVLMIQRPNAFRFEIENPRKMIYVSDGKDLWKYVPDFQHAQQISKAADGLPFMKILADPSGLGDVYHVAPWTDKEAKKLNQSSTLATVQSDYPPSRAQLGESLAIALTPKKDDQQKIIYMVLSEKTGLVSELRIVFLNGNRSRLVFSSYEAKEFPQETFHFTPPEGTVWDKL